VKALTYSAEFFPEEEDAKPSKFELWIEKKIGGERAMKFFIGLAVFLGIGFSVGLFILLPTLLAGLLVPAAGSPVAGNLIEGAIRIVLFLVYLILISRMKDIKRVFQYHGAEHKSIACYEAGLDLSVENVRNSSRFHPRCGTSFMFVMLILSIFVISILSFFVPDEVKKVTILWVLIRLPMIPLIMGIGYEFIRYAGRHDNAFVKGLSAPGLWMQRITTKEPDDDIIEVGIASLKAVITENPEDDEIK
jgi:uncharacterized protein YqhQ